MPTSCGHDAPVYVQKTGECQRCYNRRYREARTRAPHPRLVRERTPHSTPTTYGACHARVSVERGRASEHPCLHCGKTAKEWVYRPGSPGEIEGDVRSGGRLKHLHWSPDPADYDPLCQQCHIRRDYPQQDYAARRDPWRQREWNRESYARRMADEERRAARNARKRELYAQAKEEEREAIRARARDRYHRRQKDWPV